MQDGLDAIKHLQNQLQEQINSARTLHNMAAVNTFYPRIEHIQKAVCLHFHCSVVDMCSPRRMGGLVRPRHIAMYLARKLTIRSLPEIGRLFGGRDHTTVLHAVRRIEKLRAEDPAVDEQIKTVEALFASPTNPEDAICNSPPTAAQ
jgi:chromosomal replication initiator protein